MNLFDNILKVLYDNPETCSCDGNFFKVVLERATKSDNEKGIIAGDEKFLKFKIDEGFGKFYIEHTNHHSRYNNDKIPRNVFGYFQRRRLWWAYKAWLKDASFDNFINK